MGEPEPAPNESAPSESTGRADWLVGPEEGLDAEMSRNTEGGPLQAPRLMRPGADAPPPPPPAPRVRLGGGVPGPASFVPSAPPPTLPNAPTNVPQAWAGAASSVPRLHEVNAPVARPQGVDTSRVEFPMEDLDERSTAMPAAAPAALPEEPAAPRRPLAAPSEFVAPVYRPWWQEALEQLRTNRLWQIGLAGVVLIPVALVLMPKGPPKLSIREVKAHPQQYDGQTMKLSGRVTEVFPTGAGYTFYLVQGRDTMVVFTRSREPRAQQKLSVSGTLSTGFLDGQARLALFEDAQ